MTVLRLFSRLARLPLVMEKAARDQESRWRYRKDSHPAPSHTCAGGDPDIVRPPALQPAD